MKNLSLLLLFAFAIVTFQSCQKDSATDPTDPFADKDAPKLPPAATFLMPFEDFSQAKADGKVQPRTVNHWSHAVANVVIWNTILTVNLAIPTAAFGESFKHDHEYQGGGVWLWEYMVTDEQGASYKAELFGKLLGTEEVQWDMYVTQVGGFPRMHWYSGIVANDRSQATWTLNHRPNSPQEFLKIEYQRNDAQDIESIRYTNIIPGAEGNGGYIEFRKESNSANEFDRAYDVFIIEKDNLLEINWDNSDAHGRIKDAIKFEDSEWHCWGADLQDKEC